MLFDSAFAASSASESLFFAVWIAVGASALVVGAVLVIRANRVFRRRLSEVDEGLIRSQNAASPRTESIPVAA